MYPPQPSTPLACLRLSCIAIGCAIQPASTAGRATRATITEKPHDSEAAPLPGGRKRARSALLAIRSGLWPRYVRGTGNQRRMCWYVWGSSPLSWLFLIDHTHTVYKAGHRRHRQDSQQFRFAYVDVRESTSMESEGIRLID